MKRFLIAVALTSVTLPALAADVGISVSIGEPGFYGRIDIGGYPQPQVINHQPIIVDRRVSVERQPIYLRVPPGHVKHWSKHCHEYNACGERVFFVHDNWYKREYVPRYQKQHHERHDDRGRGKKNNRHNGDDHERDHDR